MENRSSALSDPVHMVRATLGESPVGPRLVCSILSQSSPQVNGLDLTQDHAWQEAMRFARAQRLLPLLHAQLSMQDIHPPQEVAAAIKDSYYRHMLFNTRYYRAMLDIIRSLQTLGLDLIVLKGAFMSANIHQNPAVRRSADLDILVRSDDLEAAARGLRALGYEQTSPINSDGNDQEMPLRSHHLPSFQKEGSPLVEVHFNLAPPSGPFLIDIDQMWQRARAVDIDHVSTLALDPIDLLLHICIHASYHHAFSYGLAQLYDIVAAIRHYGPGLDWDMFVTRAHQWRAAKSAYIALLLAQGLLDADVPRDVLLGLCEEDLDDDLRTWAVGQVLAERTTWGEMEEDPATSDLVAVPWRGFKRLVQSAFPSRQTMAYMYPLDDRPYLLPLYYLIRGFQLLVRYGHRSWAIIFGGYRKQDGMASKVAYHTFRNWLVG